MRRLPDTQTGFETEKGTRMSQSIEHLMTELDGTIPVFTKRRDTTGPHSADIEYYSQLDSILARLYKDYREAQARYDQLNDGTEHNAAMRDVAQDMRDSAWSALQTRLIEVREGDERVAAMKAMRNLRGDADALCRRKQCERDYQRQKGFRKQRETYEIQKQQSREEAANSLLAYVFLFWFQLRWAAPKAIAAPEPRSAFSRVA
jgi:hypothetical protein